MGLFSKRIPRIPPISNEPAVVEWMLKHDPKLQDVRAQPIEFIQTLYEDVLRDLRNQITASSLQARLTTLSHEYMRVLPEAAKRVQARGPLDGESEEDAIALLIEETVIAAKLRILGYFLLKKHGIQPRA